MLGSSVEPTFSSELGTDVSGDLARRPYRRDRVRRRRRLSRSKTGKRAPASDVEEGTAEFHPHHARDVPREVDLTAGFCGGVGGVSSQDPTTMMLRDVPCRYTQGALLREIDQMGFEGSYDFFYLPMDVRNKTSVGYCFINFLAAEHASRFATVFGAYVFQRHRSDKIGVVSPAKIQGLQRNLEHFFGRAVLNARDSKRRPILLQNGFKRDFGEALADLEKGAVKTAEEATAHPGKSLPLNPMAKEFVPSAFSVPLAPTSEVKLGKAFEEARNELETAVNKLLEKAAPDGKEDLSKKLTCKATCESRCLSEDTPVDGSWVANAFERLIDEVCLRPKANEGGFGGGWIGDALRVLAANGSVPNSPEKNAPERSLMEASSWVTDAFRLLVVGAVDKKPMGKLLFEDLVPTPTILTPRDELQRLRRLGGWAWIAFA